MQIDHSAFRDCKRLVEVTFEAGSNLMQFGGCAFAGCVSLRSVVIPANIRLLNNSVFFGCTSLACVTFEGAHLREVNKNEFCDCRSLKEIVAPEAMRDRFVPPLERWPTHPEFVALQ
jgi:hypothetical protein